MKSILYVGATLMIGASIYGFVDYNKNRNKRELKNMYAKKEITQPLVDKNQSSVNMDKVEPSVAEKKAVAETKKTENTVATNNTAKTKKQKKRTFRPELFSRGALDEKYIKEEIKPETPKTKSEPSKTENKEQ